MIVDFVTSYYCKFRVERYFFSFIRCWRSSPFQIRRVRLLKLTLRNAALVIIFIWAHFHLSFWLSLLKWTLSLGGFVFFVIWLGLLMQFLLFFWTLFLQLVDCDLLLDWLIVKVCKNWVRNLLHLFSLPWATSVSAIFYGS